MESNKSDCLDTSGLKWFNGASNIPLHICMFTLDYWQLANNDWIWIVVVAFLIAFILAFGIGANDVANSFGSSVGAKVLTLKQTCIILGILGAVLIGSCIWMLVALFLKLPVSATHSIVGATIGFSLVAHGASGVNWKQLSYIIGSWFASSLLSGGISTLLFLFIFKIVLSKEKPLEPSLKLLPIFYSFTIASNLFSIFYKGSQCERFQSHHGPLVYSMMLLRCVHCAILSHIRLPNLVSYPSCLSANYKDLIIYRIFISRLQISIRYLHDIFHIVYKGPISKGIPIIWVKVLLNCIQCGITMRKDHKRWCTGLVIALLFSHTVALPISDTNRGDKIHIFPKPTSLWFKFKNPETEYTCPNVDSNFNLTIKAREYKCRDGEEIVCMDSVSVGRVFFCIPKSTSCSIGIGWTVEAVDGQDVTVKESFCQEDYYQSEPSECYNACKTKHEPLKLIPPKYLLHSKGDNKGPAMLTCNAADGFYNPDNITCVAFDSNLPADFCTNVNIVNPCSEGYMPLNNGTCLDICSQAYQELVTSSKCKELSGKDRDSEDKVVPATLKPVDQGGVSTRKRNNDDMEDTNEEVNDVAEKIHRGGIKMTVVKIMVMTVGLFIISPFLVVAVLNYESRRNKDTLDVTREKTTKLDHELTKPRLDKQPDTDDQDCLDACAIPSNSLKTCIQGGELKKEMDDTFTQSVMANLNISLMSCGALINDGNLEGTVFRVGSKYVMTAYHVIKDIKHLIQTARDNIFVNFAESVCVVSCKTYRVIIEFYVKEVDIAILALHDVANLETLPKPLLLWPKNVDLPKIRNISVIGYGHADSPYKKHLEKCKILTDPLTETRVTAAKDFLQKKKEEFTQDITWIGKDHTSIDRGYGDYNNRNIIKFDCYMAKGLSGGPILTNEHKTTRVIGIVIGMRPELFYNLSHNKQATFPKDFMFEFGVKMHIVYEQLLAVNPALAQDIFPPDTTSSNEQLYP